MPGGLDLWKFEGPVEPQEDVKQLPHPESPNDSRPKSLDSNLILPISVNFQGLPEEIDITRTSRLSLRMVGIVSLYSCQEQNSTKVGWKVLVSYCNEGSFLSMCTL